MRSDPPTASTPELWVFRVWFRWEDGRLREGLATEEPSRLEETDLTGVSPWASPGSSTSLGGPIPK